MSDTRDLAARHRDFYASPDLQRFGRESVADQHEVTIRWLERTGHGQSTAILELGCGQGPAGPPWSIACDISVAALGRLDRSGRIAADMQSLPLMSGTIDFISTWAALEHVPHPEEVLSEIERVLSPGGVALLAPAWHCRPWAALGLARRRHEELSLREKLVKASIPLRNLLVWRAATEIPARLVREVRARFGPIPFTYGRLEPNLDEYVETDSDAFTSMDPQTMALYFATRGWEVLSHPSLMDRLRSRHEPVVVRKPRAR